jgi:hypothetical protein
VDIATKWAEELVRARIGDDGLSALKAHIGVFSCPLPSPLFFSRVSRVSVFEGFIDDSYSLGGGGVVSGAFMAMGHTGPHVDSSDVKGGITIAIPLSVCFHTPSFPHFSSSHVCLACVQGGTAQLCVHPARVKGVEVKGGGQMSTVMADEIGALRKHLYAGPLRTAAYGARLKNAVWGTFSSLPHGGLRGSRFAANVRSPR